MLRYSAQRALTAAIRPAPLRPLLRPLPLRFASAVKAHDVFEKVGRPLPAPATALWINHLHRVTGLFGHFVEFVTFAGNLFGYDVGKMLTQNVDSQITAVFSDAGMNVVKVIPRVKEGGDFVYFRNMEEAKAAQEYILAMDFQERHVDAHIVYGEPFIEDLVFLRAFQKIRVAFPDGVKVNEDYVFSLFRIYGKIQEVRIEKNVAEVLYILTSSAISARNCRYRYKEPGWSGSLDISFIPYSIWKIPRVVAAFNNPRLIPLWALLFALVLLMFLEPIRLTYVVSTVSMRWTEEGNMPDYNMREDDVANIDYLLSGAPKSVILISGPRGSGKSVVAKRLAQHRTFTVRVSSSSESIAQSSIEGALVDSLEKAIGFWPSFSTINKIFMWIESALPSKTNLQSTKVVQLDNILWTLQNALKLISLMKRSERSPVIIFDRFHDLIYMLEYASPEERKNAEILITGLLKWCTKINEKKLAHIVIVGDLATEQKIRALNPQISGKIHHYDLNDVPQEVAEDFLRTMLKEEPKPASSTPRTSDHNDTSDHAEHKEDEPVPKSGPDADNGIGFFNVLRNVTNVATRGGRLFLPGVYSEEIDDTVRVKEGTVSEDAFERAVRIVGGRPSDLQMLMVYLERGLTLNESIDELVNETKSGIISAGFGHQFAENKTKGPWTKTHLWKLMNLLVKNESVLAAEATAGVFKGNTEILQALVNAQIIESKTDHLEREFLTASPIYRHCFRLILDDKFLQQHLEKLIKESLVNDIKKEIVSIEEELHKLSLSARGDGSSSRMKYLDHQLYNWQQKLSQTESQ